MRKRFLPLIMAAMLLLGGCADSAAPPNTQELSAENFHQALLDAAQTLPESTLLHFDEGLEITGLGVTYDGRPEEFDGCYYFPAMEKMTGVRVSVDWQDSEGYSSAVAATLLSGEAEMPDLINPTDFGMMDLADDGVIIPLDDYLELMPEIVKAVGEERMDAWRASDGHIYTIPSVSEIRGSFSMMVRSDWLKDLGMKEPETWEDWLAYWRAVRDNDLNGNGDPSDEIPVAFAGGTDGERSLTMLMNAFGIAASNDTQFCVLEDGTYTMVYEHPRYPEYLEAVTGLYAEGILREDYESDTYASIEEAMGNNTLGSTMTFAASGAKAEELRKNGDGDALWQCVKPLTGPYGDCMIQEREGVLPVWSITAAAQKRGKAEDIVRFFNWCYSKEGYELYNYGIEGVSYQRKDGMPVLEEALVRNGFSDYRAAGINYEPFGGYWQTDAYMQCLFAGKPEAQLSDIQQEIYQGLFVKNEPYFYTQPATVETESYVKYRTSLITEGVCRLRDSAICGEITPELFFSGYKQLKAQGLEKVMEDGRFHYQSMKDNGENRNEQSNG